MSNGPEYVDDQSIGDDEDLWRRLPASWVKYDNELQTNRVTSQAFQNSPDRTPTSVSISSELNGPGELLEDHPGYGIGSLTAGHSRSCGQGICRNPLPEKPAHAYIFGAKTRPNMRCLARGCEIIVVPFGSP